LSDEMETVGIPGSWGVETELDLTPPPQPNVKEARSKRTKCNASTAFVLRQGISILI